MGTERQAGAEHGFLLRHGTFTTYNVPGATGTVVGFDTHHPAHHAPAHGRA